MTSFLTRTREYRVNAMKIVAAKKILKANDQLAAENRARLDAAGVFGVNVVGSPGSGKTTLLEALFAHLKGRLRPAVIEGDIAGSIDADRMEKIGVPVVQINTDGACHLDANMIAIGQPGTRLRGGRSAGDRERGQPGLHGRLRPRRAPADRRPQHQRRRRQGREISGHFSRFPRPVHHEDRPAAALELQRRADHGRHAAAGPAGRRVPGLGHPRRRHPGGRRLAGGEDAGKHGSTKVAL